MTPMHLGLPGKLVESQTGLRIPSVVRAQLVDADLHGDVEIVSPGFVRQGEMPDHIEATVPDRRKVVGDRSG